MRCVASAKHIRIMKLLFSYPFKAIDLRLSETAHSSCKLNQGSLGLTQACITYAMKPFLQGNLIRCIASQNVEPSLERVTKPQPQECLLLSWPLGLSIWAGAYLPEVASPSGDLFQDYANMLLKNLLSIPEPHAYFPLRGAQHHLHNSRGNLFQAIEDMTSKCASSMTIFSPQTQPWAIFKLLILQSTGHMPPTYFGS